MLFSEILRPTEFADLIQPVATVRRFERMASDGNVMNMLFYGKPGTGKTSAARLLLTKADADFIVINGSMETGIDSVRSDLVMFCNTGSIYAKQKMCLIDECEFLSANAQAGLRGLIEQPHGVRFVLTANDIRKIHPALKSRCLPVFFDPNVRDADGIIKRLISRYRTKLAEAGLSIDDKTLEKIVYTGFPDFRLIASEIDFLAALLDAA